MSLYKHILIALDLSSDNESIVERAFSLAVDSTAVSLIYVQEPIAYPSAYVGDAPLQAQELMHASAQKMLEDIGERYNIPSGLRYIETGRSAAKIHDIAKANDVDLIVVGSHGRHGVQLLLGSTANAVLHGASCDVLAVRIHKRE